VLQVDLELDLFTLSSADSSSSSSSSSSSTAVSCASTTTTTASSDDDTLLQPVVDSQWYPVLPGDASKRQGAGPVVRWFRKRTSSDLLRGSVYSSSGRRRSSGVYLGEVNSTASSCNQCLNSCSYRLVLIDWVITHFCADLCSNQHCINRTATLL
jgi:hypothetical protein